jgi:hypothetical protein
MSTSTPLIPTASSNVVVLSSSSSLIDSVTTATSAPDGPDAGVIAGAVFGCIYVIIVTSLVVYCYLKQKREKAQRPPPAEDTLEAIHQRLQREDTIKNNLVAANASQQQDSS